MARRTRQGPRDQGRTVVSLEELYNPVLLATNSLEKAVGDLAGTTQDRIATPIRFGIFKLTDAITKFVAQSFQLQRQSLALNKDFSAQINSAGDRFEKVPGSLAQSLGSLFAFQSEGLDFVGKETITLANRMQITGQNMAKLVQLTSRNTIVGMMSNTQIANLNQSLLDSAKSSQVTTDKLIDSLSELTDSLPMLGLTGGAGAAQNAIKELTEKFPAIGKDLGKFTNMLVSPQTTTAQLALLDGYEIAEKAARGQITSGEELRKAVAQFAQGAKTFVGGDFKNLPRDARNAMMQVASPLGVAAINIENAINNMPEVQRSATDMLMKDVGTAFNTALKPLATNIGRLATRIGTLLAKLTVLVEAVTNSSIATRFLGTIVVARLLPGLRTPFTFLRHAIDRNSRMLAMVNARRATQGLAKIGPAMLMVGRGLRLLSRFFLPLLIFEGLLFAFNKITDSTDKLADAENAKAQVEREKIARESFGETGFESLTRRIIQDSMFRVAAQEAVMVNALNKLSEDVVTAVRGTTTAVEDSAPATSGGLRPTTGP